MTDSNCFYCTVYRHWRTGKLMYASAYGYKAWRFFGRRRRR
ncbi:MAG TPA: hypothetical protein PLS53_02165 [Thermoanaerobaculaceae bacterium]|nr:hypothetical protein [Thermoanaerobaculaceae bacterium]